MSNPSATCDKVDCAKQVAVLTSDNERCREFQLETLRILRQESEARSKLSESLAGFKGWHKAGLWGQGVQLIVVAGLLIGLWSSMKSLLAPRSNSLISDPSAELERREP